MKNTITLVDFGTGKIVVMIADISDRQRLNILGLGSVEYDGYANKKWNNEEGVSKAIEQAMVRAVESTGGRVKSLNPNDIIIFGIPAEFTYLKSTIVEKNLAATNTFVTREELMALFEEAEKVFIKENENDPSERLDIGRGPSWFIVDDKRTMEPLNKRTDNIKAKIVSMYARPEFYYSVRDKFAMLGYKKLGIMSSAMGVLPFYLDNDELSNVTFMADVGYLSTELIAFQGEMPVYTKIIPIGGAHITMDLAYGLKVNMELAEKLKRKYDFNGAVRHVEVADSDTLNEKYTHEQLSAFINPRVDELCKLINDAIEESEVKYLKGAPIYVTGGGIIMNPGSKEYLRMCLGRTVRELSKNMAKFGEAHNTSVMGLLFLAMNSVSSAKKDNKVFKFFRELFGG